MGQDAQLTQRAIDAAEGGGTVLFTSGVTYVFLTNVYLGNINIVATGATWDIRDTGSFVTSGTGSLRTIGCVLSKSGSGAGYGLSNISVTFDALTITMTKSASGVGGTLLLEKVSSFSGTSLSITVANSSGVQCNSLDFYSAVQNVSIPTVTISLDNGDSSVQGGFWIRNKVASPATTNVNISTLNITKHVSADEAFAIFNDVSANGDVNNIHLGTVTVAIPSGGRGLVGSCYNAATYDAAKFANIQIDSLTATVAGFTNAPFMWKTQSTAPTVTAITLTNSGSSSLGTNAFGIRHITGSGQTARPQYGTAVIHCDTDISVSNTAYCVDGSVDIADLTIDGSGTGWTAGLHNVGTITTGALSIEPTAFQIDGATAFSGTASGKFGLNNCLSFVGTLSIDTASFTGIAFQINSSQAPTTNIVFDGTINLTGASALARIFLAQANGGALTNIPCKVRYVLNNPSTTITSPDSVSNKCFFNAWDCFQDASGTITPRNNGGTKTLASHVATMSATQYSGAIDTQSAAPADTWTTLNGATVDGQIFVAYDVNAGRIVTAVDTIGNFNLGSNVVLQAAPTSVSQVLGLRWNVGTSKWDKVSNGGW